ncbi:hypothetical protein [Aliiroseovarius lamellibrachiae]|uniref:NrdR family transcriptional regulator n=1 Tax=Aliiroseovarius lamellibrachiae TaxID=1924933 RepID=UPI001BE059B0|nr:hypothetical protein [Aliiroseovarius lamellibrachiae]MBT2131203.1 hypothetical protein [Aliiroseovarius lamellibrachiae]
MPDLTDQTCPFCGPVKTNVIDSRPVDYRGVRAIRRRRVCPTCTHRFTTFELSEATINHGPTIEELLKEAKIDLLKTLASSI